MTALVESIRPAPRPRAPALKAANRSDASPALRSALRVLAAQPAVARAAGPGLAPVRRLLDQAFMSLDARAVLGLSRDGLAEARGRLADDLMIGLLHVVRASVDRRSDSMVPPLAVLALGEYGRRRWSREPLALLLLLPEDAPTRGRAERIAAALRRALGELAIPVVAETATVAIVADRAAKTPNLRARLADRRQLWGRADLPAHLAERLSA